MSTRAATDHGHLHGQDAERLLRHAEKKLRDRGERVTAARRAILTVLARQPEHFSADELAAQLESHGVHRTTVYRTLERFSEVGIVSRRQMPGGAAAYHLASSSHAHGHCLRCGDVVALPAEAFEELSHEVRTRTEFAIDLHKSTFTGLCGACSG